MKNLFLILVLSLTSLPALSAQQELSDIKEKLKKEITEVVKEFDPSAYVLLEVQAKKVEQSLPTTPLLLPDLVVRNRFNQIVLDQVRVQVYSQAEKLPDSVEEMIQLIVADHNVEAKIEMKIPPQKFTLPITGDQVVENVFSPENIDNLLLYGMFIVASLAFVIFVLLFKSSAQKLNHSLLKSVGEIKAAMEESSPITNFQEEKELQRGPISEAEMQQEDKLIEGLSLESAIALLSDCYWAEEDIYAAYLWKRFSVEKRQGILKSKPDLKVYCNSISEMNPRNLNFHQDPYYIDPLKLDHINNEDLTRLVKKNPELFNFLPSLRTENLNLEVKEKLNFIAKDKEINVQNIEMQLQNISPSKPRVIAKQARIKISTTEEEEQALALENINLQIKENIVILGWALELNDEELDQILNKFTAPDLASAWVSTDSVLEKLKNVLPEKKQSLVASYLERQKPSRTSPAFKRLHREIMNALYSRESQPDGLNEAA